MEARVGNLIFTSKFDSGNLAKVEKVTRDDDDEPVNTSKMTMLLLLFFICTDHFLILKNCLFPHAATPPLIPHPQPLSSHLLPSV